MDKISIIYTQPAIFIYELKKGFLTVQLKYWFSLDIMLATVQEPHLNEVIINTLISTEL